MSEVAKESPKETAKESAKEVEASSAEAPSLDGPAAQTLHSGTEAAGVQPWVQVLSRFTSEALFFESLAVSVFAALYLAFWILKKRKYGSANEVVPSTLVKTYLSQLIGDAEGIRTQLFGFLDSGSTEPRMNLGPALNAVSSGASDPAMASRVAEQAKQIESLNDEKMKLQAEVEELKKGGGGAAASAPTIDNSAETAALQAKIKELTDKIEQLEGRLNEYSVIEDDLANLKRLQQENKKLKEELAGKGGSAPAADAALPEAAAAAAVPAAATSQDELDSLLGAAPAAADPAPLAEADPAPAAAEAAPAPAAAEGFEGLLGSVDNSLPANPAGASVADPLAALGADAPPAGGQDILAEVAADGGGDAKPAGEKNDADLVAEFEKMLNG
ncbi:MAG: hypothetical protein JNL01_04365 [Bdellovibrionales bacterium]|nr:hypothetical protein [Bdellovibrionales bacterium]